MPVYSAEAVVLRKVDYGEADRIMTLFTLERGKVPAIAKSVRRARSRMSGQLDVFAHGRMLLAEGKRMDIITQFQRITDTSRLGDDLARSAAAAVVMEVADKVLEERHPQPDLYALVRDGLGRLSAGDTNPRLELIDFLVRVLAELGYSPELRNCARCGRALGEEEGLAFAPLSGGVICASCDQKADPSTSIASRTVKVLRVAASGDRDLFFRLRLDDEDIRRVEDALESQLEHHLDRQLKSIDFLRRIQ